MDKISVIIPVYNVEKYLSACIKSILNQTHRNLELILIDDGSKDNSGQICDEFAKKDSRIRVIHQENGGVSVARNKGVDISEGDYIAFVDSDDFVAPNMYESLLKAIKRTDADMALCNYRKVDEEGATISEYTYVQNEVVSGEKALEWLEREHNWSYVVVWPKLYHRSVFENIRFKEKVICEDEFAVHHIFLKCKKIVTISDSLYCYRYNPSSITSVNTIRRLDGLEALYERFLVYQKRGLKHLLRGTINNARRIIKRAACIKCATLEERQRIKQIIAMFRSMVYQLRWRAGLMNHVIATCPILSYRIISLLKTDRE